MSDERWRIIDRLMALAIILIGVVILCNSKERYDTVHGCIWIVAGYAMYIILRYMEDNDQNL